MVPTDIAQGTARAPGLSAMGDLAPGGMGGGALHGADGHSPGSAMAHGMAMHCPTRGEAPGVPDGQAQSGAGGMVCAKEMKHV